ncbi:MAG: plasmid replication initiator TrfA [Methylococcaceae bacterium]|nr:plasmid replication initiator TrfA [Methylococcaceae bacterium]
MSDTQKQISEILEQQLETENPDLDAGLRRSLARYGAVVAMKKAEETDQQKSKTKVVQLDFWEDGKHAAPNAVFRSALFPALNPKQKDHRRFLKEERIYGVSGIEILFTGEQFDQSDLDVYLELLNMAQPYPLGTPIKFSAYSLLKALGLTTGGKDHKRLHSVLIRLCGGVVDMADHKKRFFGQPIHGGIRDEITLNYEITINPKFAVLFGLGMWATIDKAQRRALGRNATAKSLHAYYSSHAAPGAHSFDTLAEIAGLTNSNKRQTRAAIIKAHELMKTVGFLDDYEPQGNTIKVNIRHTSSQLRHIAKKARKPRAKRPPQG